VHEEELNVEKEYEITITINGKRYQRRVEARKLLVDFLRDDLGLTGTHIGCDTGHCGACTVMLNGVTVKSCLLFAIQANNSTIKTIEGVANEGKLHPLQTAFLEQNALQCGYCTPGMILSSMFLLQRNPNPNEGEIKRSIEGNLCRCTGYLNIVKAVKDACRISKKT
jgi:aerobic-type carbon monoxide dehydrogenase small subunit (CoxS/CutS family)